MIRFSDVVAEANADGVLEPVAGASVTVLISSNSTPAVIFDELGAPISNPVTTDSLGRFDFFCRTGKYDLVVSHTSITTYTRQGVLIGDGTIHASDYAIADGISDAVEGLQAALDEAAAIVTAGGASVVVDLDGGQYLLGAQIVVGSRTTLQNGTLIADPGADWGDDGEGMPTRALIETSFGATQVTLTGLVLGCGMVSNGILLGVGTGSFNNILYNTITAFGAFGIRIQGGGGNRTEGNIITQINSSQQEFNDDESFTGVGLWVQSGDQKIFRNIIRWTGVCLNIEVGTCLVSDNHFYNGRVGGVLPRYRPVIIENRQRGNLYTGNYFDNGEIRLYDTRVTFCGNRHTLNTDAATIDGVYVAYAAEPGDTFLWLTITDTYLAIDLWDGEPPYIKLVEDGGNTWAERESAFALYGTANAPDIYPRSRAFVRTGYSSARVAEFRGRQPTAMVCMESSTTTNNAVLPGFGAYANYAVIGVSDANHVFVDPSGRVGINGLETEYMLSIYSGSTNHFKIENTSTVGTAIADLVGVRNSQSEIVGTLNITDREAGPRAAFSGRTVTSDNTGGMAVISSATAGVLTERWAVDEAGALRPWTHNEVDIGTTDLRVKDIYLTNAPTVTSDSRLKNVIGDSDLGLEFIQELRPVAYTVITSASTQTSASATTETVLVPVTRPEEYESVDIVDGAAVLTIKTRDVPIYDSLPVVDSDGNPVYVMGADGNPTDVPQTYLSLRTEEVIREVPALESGTTAGTRTHYGLIAQEVKDALDALSVASFAGWGMADPEDEESTQHLRYEEFIAPLIKAVQELAARVTALEPPP